MFEKITIREQQSLDKKNPLDLGLILESMLFYRKTIVICNSAISLGQMLKTLGLDNITKLIESETLEIVFSESFSGIVTNKTISTGLEIHNPVTFTSPDHTLEQELRRICVDITGREGRGRRVANSFDEKIKKFNYSSDFTNNVKNIFLDESYLNKSAHSLIKNWIPELDKENLANFKIEESDNGFIVNTKLDFDRLNKYYGKYYPPSHSSLTPAYILSNIFDVETDLFHASNNLSEIISTPEKSKLIEIRLSYLMERYTKSKNQKENFLKTINPTFFTIRDDYNKGNLELNKIINAILHANKFKKWLGSLENDEDLLNQYLQEISKESFFKNMPSKFYRWTFFLLGGIFLDSRLPSGFGTISGIALSFIDNFLFDKFVIGWKPNQFINQYLFNEK